MNEKPHEGRMVRKRLTPESERVTLYAFERWLVSSNRGLGQLRQANNNISERSPNMVLMTSGKTPDNRGIIRNRNVYIIKTNLTSFIKGITLISSEGNKPYEIKFERMNGKTDAQSITIIATRLQFLS